MALVMEVGFSEGSGTTAADTSGNGFNCTTGLVGWTASGHAGSGYEPTSVNTVTWPVTGVGGSVFTIMGWLFRTGAPGASTVVCNAGTSGATRWALQSTGAITAIGGRSTGVIAASTWTHVAFVANGTTARTCYVNGVQVDQDTGSQSFLSATVSYALTSGTTAFLIWDDLRLFDHALTQTEVQTWMANNVGGGTAHAATGTVAVTTAASGSPVARLVATGTVAVLTAASGAPAALHPATATTPVTTTAAGSPTARHPATGTVAVTTTASGTAVVVPASGSFAATGTVTVTTSATGAPTARHPATGTCAAVSAAAGSPSVRYVANGTVIVVTTASGTAFAFDPSVPQPVASLGIHRENGHLGTHRLGALGVIRSNGHLGTHQESE